MKGFASRLKRVAARPAVRAAVLLVLVSAVVLLWWRIADADWIDAWMPNIVTGLLALAATITFVEWIVQREARGRLAPWRERVLDDLRFAVMSFGWGVSIDYASTHLRSFKPFPADVLEFFDIWLAERTTRDACSVPREEMPVSLVVHSGFDLAETLRRCRERDLDAMTPALVRAIDDAIGTATEKPFSRPDLRSWPAAELENVEEGVVQRVREFVRVLAREDPSRGRLVFQESVLRGMEAHSAVLLVHRIPGLP